jgi:hypothetical protein
MRDAIFGKLFIFLGLYAVVILFLFLILPFMYFYFEEQDDEVTCKMVCVTDNGLYNAWETVYYLLLYKVLQTF